MGRKLAYKPGSYYRVDDRTGFCERAEHTRKQWNNIYTRPQSWEARQPQDFVKGRRDNQNVPDPRSLAPNQFIGVQTTISLFCPQGSRLVAFASVAGMSVGDFVSILLDDGNVLITQIESFTTGDFSTDFSSDFSIIGIQIGTPLPYSTSSGNDVIDISPGAISASAFPGDLS